MMRKTFSRFAALALALMMTLSLLPVTARADFSDVQPGSWYYSDVMECVRAGAAAGFEDGTFRPNDNVTYAQLAVMLTRTFYNDMVNAVTDTAGQPWYYANMKVLVDRNFHNGTDIKNKGGWPVVLVANDNINRYEMARLFHNIICYEGQQASIDAINAAPAKIGDWAQVESDLSKASQVSVKNCYSLGVITGMSDGSFSGKANMTRAQACTVLMRTIRLIKGEATVQPSQPAQPSQPVQPEQPAQPRQTEEKTLANGQPITVENVLAIIEQVKQQYPTGTHWGRSNEPGTNYYAAGNGNVDVLPIFNIGKGLPASRVYACSGFATLITDAIFGPTGFPCREVTDYSKIRPGDIIIVMNSKGEIGHVSTITTLPFQTTGLSGTRYWSVYTGDGNDRSGGDHGIVYWFEATRNGDGWVTFSDDDPYIVYTRYPD